MPKPGIIALVALVMTLFLMPVTQATTETAVGQVRKAIEEENEKFVEALRQGNAAALAAFYTEDTIVLPPNSEMIQGKES